MASPEGVSLTVYSGDHIEWSMHGEVFLGDSSAILWRSISQHFVFVAVSLLDLMMLCLKRSVGKRALPCLNSSHFL